MRKVTLTLTLVLCTVLLGFYRREATTLLVYGTPRQVLVLPKIYAGLGEELTRLDLNGDGLQDFVVLHDTDVRGAPPRRVAYVVNDGHAGFKDATKSILRGTPPTTMNPDEMVVADLNSDGRPDMFMPDGGWDSDDVKPGWQNNLILSDGANRLFNATMQIPQYKAFTYSAAGGDIDGDGDIDLFVDIIGGPDDAHRQPELWHNDGWGHFTIAEEGRLPIAPEIPGHSNTPLQGLFVDVNNDDRLDMVLAGDEYEGDEDSQVGINNGAGWFTILPNALPDNVFNNRMIHDIQSADFNKDGFQDLIVHGWDYREETPFTAVLINNHNGTFRLDSHGINFPRNYYYRKDFLSLECIDGDQNIDLMTFGVAPADVPTWFLHNGAGRLVKLPNNYPGPCQPFRYTPIDTDGDGGRDIVFTVGDPPETFSVMPDVGPVLAPGVPREVFATRRMTTRVTVSWRYVWGATSHQVWRSENKATQGSLLGTTDKTWFYDRTAPTRTPWYYFVRAVDSAGTSDYGQYAIGERP